MFSKIIEKDDKKTNDAVGEIVNNVTNYKALEIVSIYG